MNKLYDVESGETQDEFLNEDKLGELLTIFWANNITDFAPETDAQVLLDGNEVKVVGSWFAHHFEYEKKGTTYTRDTGLLICEAGGTLGMVSGWMNPPATVTDMRW